MIKYFGVAFVCICSQVCAFKVNPMQMELTPKKGQGFFTVINNTDREEIVLAKVKTREVDPLGNETNNDCDDFVVYPSHLVIKAGEQRLVRLIWKNTGKEKFDVERNYRMIFEQSLVNIPKTEIDIQNAKDARTSIGFGVKYVASLYLKPHEKIKPNIIVTSHAIEKREKGDVLVLHLENKGNQHKVLSPRTLEVNLEVKNNANGADGNKTFPLSDDLISQIDKGINVLAGNKRIIEVPINDEVPKEIVSVSICD